MTRKSRPVGQHKNWPQRFWREVQRLQVALGLLDWTFRCEIEKGDGDTVAQVTTDAEARDALFKVFLSGPTAETPERVALHEVLHVLYTEAFEIAAQRGAAGHADVQREEHKAIERLTNLICGRL